ncbi:MAG: hypothetical protein KatS3mg090_0576 [Patescibacteria group bacterium]|nr:MAG: hypothetical protein KatS3mg090_0576 [Patescibacteria group bacterium]
MIRLVRYTIVWILFFIFIKSSVFAFSQNKFGIHLARPDYEEVVKAANLVNSSGGEWGYVTVVMQENERDLQRWQDFFNELRRHKLIPIVRLASSPEGSVWRRPDRSSIDDWVNFLQSLNWVVKDRYIILFNEPNHAVEWGGRVDPVDYADTALEFAKRLKQVDSNYFIMLAGVDLAAPDSMPNYMSADRFITTVVNRIGKENFETFFSGWASHSYPNPSFSASVFKTGRLSVQGYKWELSLLRSLGIDKDLPVFITETGWRLGGSLSESLIADYYRYAFVNIWLPDKDVVAVTPFILNYHTEPFASFSWQKPNQNDFYEFYNVVSEIPKVQGDPEIIDTAEIKGYVGKKLIANSKYRFKIEITNTGQKIWSDSSKYKMTLVADNNKDLKDSFDIKFTKIPQLEPEESSVVYLDFFTKKPGLDLNLYLVLKDDRGYEIAKTEPWFLEVSKSPSLFISLRLFPKVYKPTTEVEVQIFDNNDSLVFKKKPVKIVKGEGFIDQVFNIEYDKKYRVVVLKEYYLPRQSFVVFRSDQEKINLKSLLPLDLDADGAFEVSDLLKSFVSLSSWSRWLPF